jgi:hypothetical protein
MEVGSVVAIVLAVLVFGGTIALVIARRRIKKRPRRKGGIGRVGRREGDKEGHDE